MFELWLLYYNVITSPCLTEHQTCILLSTHDVHCSITESALSVCPVCLSSFVYSHFSANLQYLSPPPPPPRTRFVFQARCLRSTHLCRTSWTVSATPAPPRHTRRRPAAGWTKPRAAWSCSMTCSGPIASPRVPYKVCISWRTGCGALIGRPPSIS